MLIDSSDRVSGNPYNFVCDLQSNVPRARYVKLKKLIVPKIDNVNAGNNSFIVKSALGTTGLISLSPGMYNTTSLANEITAQMNARFVLDGFVDTFTVNFNVVDRSFTITSVGGNNFFIDSTSDLIVFGSTLVPFPSELLASVPSGSVITSGPAAMLSTRYFILTSQGLTQNQFGRSIISSSTHQVSNIVEIIDVSGIYSPIDFDIGIPYKGIYESLNVPGNKISVMNSSDILPRHLDFQILDGYKRDLSTLFNNGSDLSVVLVFEIIF